MARKANIQSHSLIQFRILNLFNSRVPLLGFNLEALKIALIDMPHCGIRI